MGGYTDMNLWDADLSGYSQTIPGLKFMGVFIVIVFVLLVIRMWKEDGY